MKNTEIIRETKRLFGKDRRSLKKLLLSYKFDGSDTKRLNKIIGQATHQPFSLEYGIFDTVVESIAKNAKIDMFWIGDLSWNCIIPLNSNIDILINWNKKGNNWDKKLCSACKGTVRICEFIISDTLPVYTYDLYYMTYNKDAKWYEFGPISKTSRIEQITTNSVSKALEADGRAFVDKSLAKMKFKDLYTDTNDEGGATIFDCLFSDSLHYQEEYLRFPENTVNDKIHNCTTSWKEYFDKPGKLIKREEWRYYKSGNAICIMTNRHNQITEIKVYRDAGKFKHKEFRFNIDENIIKLKNKYDKARPVPRKRP